MSYPQISSLPTPPSRQDPANFADEADAFLGAIPTFRTETNAAGVYIDSKASEVEVNTASAASSASDALTYRDQSLDYRNQAVAASGAELWVTGTTYAIGDAVISPTNFKSYRDTVGGVSSTDPVEDSTRWSVIEIDTLEAIATTKAETAVDVFVYDTSKDSDGGAWRKRTQHTSWYNETLNTATRGSRREFPAVAVIVAEADTVTIYDGDDPALPMWMVFERASDSYFASSSQLLTAIFMRNGVFVWGSSSTGTREIDFLAESALLRRATADTLVLSNPISGRNSGNSTTADASVPRIVDNAVNDVAMTVLPDAPIDPATGLPVPTIAVATDGGVSVIKDDGTVVDITTDNATYTVAHNVAFDDLNRINIGFGNSINSAFSYYYRFASVPPADTEIDLNNKTATGLAPVYFATSNPAVAAADVVLVGQGDTSVPITGITQEIVANEKGLNFLSGSDLIVHTTSTYNTGWMNGDIKLAALSDTDDTDLVGSGELVTNGTFDTDTSGWTAGADTTISVVSNRLRVTNVGTNYGYAYQAFSTTVGKTYTASVDITYNIGRARVLIANAPTATISSDIEASSTGTYTYTFVASATTTYINVGNRNDTDAFNDFDNVSVKLADEDRSVNNNGLIVNGTVTRSPVATGADLVAYSGFTTSNYLEQPYNSDLDFGTGDFCVMGWVNKLPSGSGTIFSRLDTSATPEGIILFSTTAHQIYGTIGPFNSSADTSVVSHPTGTWVHVVFMRRSGSLDLYLDGRLVSQSTNTEDTNGTNGDGRVAIGSRPDGDSAFPGSLALLRISATAPTAEQIAKIYEDEKFLFQENAQATLYGSSDAVTALAHDPVTDLLHVGTSAGRSVFQGLRRVENTTDAVGTAISASNNLVVEE